MCVINTLGISALRLEYKFNNIFINTTISEESFILEIEFLVSNQFDKGIGYSPWMRFFNNQSFNNNSIY